MTTRWSLIWHFIHCILHSLLLNLKQFHLRLPLTQSLVQEQCRGDRNSLADKPVDPPLQCATHTIWGTFAMTGFKVVPGSSCKTLLENVSTKEVKMTTLLVLCARTVAKTNDGCHIWSYLSDFSQDGLQVLPYGR